VAEIIWTAHARDDLEAIHTFIKQADPNAARYLIDRIATATERLSLFPDSGRIVPEKGDPSIREVIVENYRVMYKRSDDRVEILTVFHGAQTIRITDL
jgi:plasmid stabilization system protein ParE